MNSLQVQTRKKSVALLQLATKEAVERKMEVWFIIWTSMGWSYTHAPLRRIFTTKNGVGFKVEGTEKVFAQKDLYPSEEIVKFALQQLISNH